MNAEDVALEHLPLELLSKISEFMPLSDFLHFILSCNAFLDMTTYDDIWRRLYVRELQAEKRALGPPINRTVKSQLNNINKQLRRHTDFSHVRLIKGNEFSFVLKQYTYLRLKKQMYKDIGDKMNTFSTQCAHIERIAHICDLFTDKDANTTFSSMYCGASSSNIYSYAYIALRQIDGKDKQIFLDRFKNTLRIIYKYVPHISDFTLKDILHNTEVLKNAIDLLPHPRSNPSDMFEETIRQLLQFDDYTVNKDMNNSELLEYLFIEKVISQEAITRQVNRSLAYHNLGVVQKIVALAGTFAWDTLSIYYGTICHPTFEFVQWIEKLIPDELMWSVLYGVAIGGIYHIMRLDHISQVLDVMRYILEDRKIDMNIPILTSYIVYLILAVCADQELDVVRILLEHGADLEKDQNRLKEVIQQREEKEEVIKILKQYCKLHDWTYYVDG
jgi:hypothetical protein